MFYFKIINLLLCELANQKTGVLGAGGRAGDSARRVCSDNFGNEISDAY